jgi:hypothetical protein
MNIGFDIFTFDGNNIYFTEKKKNTIIQGIFTKIFYSTNSYTMNGIYIKLPVSIKAMSLGDKDTFTMNYANIQSGKIFHTISWIEETLLDHYKLMTKTNKHPIYSLKTQLMYGPLKIYRENNNMFPFTQENNEYNDIYCGDKQIVRNNENNYIYPTMSYLTQRRFETAPHTQRSTSSKLCSGLTIENSNNAHSHSHSDPEILNGLKQTSTPCKSDSQYIEQLLLKIAGIWENDTNFGITFKFLCQ